MEDFKPNSNRVREQDSQRISAERRTDKVISGNAHRRRKSGINRTAGTIVTGDLNSVLQSLWMDTLVPSIKRAISEFICNGVNMLLGEPIRSKQGAKTPYRSYYERQDERRTQARSQTHSAYAYDDIGFDSRGEAEEVLFRMEEILDRFESVSVAELFEMAGIKPNYTDNKYGWKNLEDAHVVRIGDEYVIRLPKATML